MGIPSAGSGIGPSVTSDVLLSSASLTPVLQPAPSIIDVLAGQVAGVDRDPSAQQDTMKSLQRELTATVGKADLSEKPAEKGPVVSDKTSDAHGASKEARVEAKQEQLAADVKVITDKMAALQEGAAAPSSGGSAARTVAGQAVSTIATAALSAVMPPVGAALALGDVVAAASIMGKGTEVTFSQAPSELGSRAPSSDKRGGGYARSESAPQSTALSASVQAPAPVLAPVDMSNGPGFGPKPPSLAEIERTDKTLRDDYLKGIDFKLEDTVRGQSLNAALEDSRRVQNIVARVNARGLDDPDQVDIALKRGLIRDNQLGQTAPRPMIG